MSSGAARLNPKLTARAVMPNASSAVSEISQTPRSLSDHEDDSENDEEGSEEEEEDTSAIEIPKKVNPRRHLLHNGTWVPKQVIILVCSLLLFIWLFVAVGIGQTCAQNWHMGLLR